LKRKRKTEEEDKERWYSRNKESSRRVEDII